MNLNASSQAHFRCNPPSVKNITQGKRRRNRKAPAGAGSLRDGNINTNLLHG